MARNCLNVAWLAGVDLGDANSIAEKAVLQKLRGLIKNDDTRAKTTEALEALK